MDTMKKKLTTLLIASSLLITGCSDTISQLPIGSNKEEELQAIISNYNIVFMFSQVSKNDMTVLDTISSLRDEYGFRSETILLTDDSNITSSLRTVVESNADIVIGYGQGMAIVFDLFEDSYPDTKYVVIDGQARDEDIKSISYDNATLSYALGVTIATAFGGNKNFGYIGDFENDNNIKYKSGYIKGLQSVNSGNSIDIEYVESATDYQAAYDLTVQYQSMGVKFVMNATNPTISEGIYQACLDLAQEGKYIYTNAFGLDATNTSNPYILSGIIKDYDYATNLAVNDFIEGNFTSKDIQLSAEHDALHLLDITSLSARYTNTDILNDNSIKAGRKALDDIKNRNIIL